MKYIYIIPALLLLLCSCEKEEIIRYEEQHHAVVFPGKGDAMTYGGYNAQTRTYSVTFSFLSTEMGTTQATATLPVKVAGVPLPYDRKVNYRVEEEGSTATTGQYTPKEALIPAGEAYGTISVELYYDEELLTEERKIRITLLPSDDLLLGPNEYIRGELIWHSKLLPPATSATKRTYNHLIAGEPYRTSTTLNTYSPAAHRLILTVLGWEVLPSYSAAPYFVYSAYPAFRMKIQQYLDQWNEENPGQPLLHDAGTLKGSPITVRVD